MGVSAGGKQLRYFVDAQKLTYKAESDASVGSRYENRERVGHLASNRRARVPAVGSLYRCLMTHCVRTEHTVCLVFAYRK